MIGLDFTPFVIDISKAKDYLVSLIIAIILTYTVIFIVRKALSIFFKRTNFIDEKKEQTIESVFKNTSNYIAFFIIVMVALKPFVDVKNLLVAGGVLGIVIGFGAQSVIKDILYGFFFLFEGQIKKGDYVHINESPDGGTVEDLGFRSLKVRLLNGKLLTISNGEIKQVINGNIERRRIFESVIVSFREDPSRMKLLLQSVCDELNERHTSYLMKEKDGSSFIEPYQVYGLSSMDAHEMGFRFSICATTNDVDYLIAVQETKELIAQKVFDEKIKMPEQSVFYQTRANVK